MPSHSHLPFGVGPPKYRPDIDGLRALAVLPVVVFHAGGSFLSGGYVGVDVFFVISGFLITSMIIEEVERGEFSIIHFYERRVRRIFPAAFAMLLGSSVLAWLMFAPSELREFGQSVVAASTFVSNVFFWLQTDYFGGPAHTKPLLHTWSLAVEEQFYIAFPWILAVAYRWQRRAVASLLWGLLLASLAVGIWATERAPSSAFYLAPYRAWELLLGSVLALKSVPNVRQPWLQEALSALGVLLIGGSIIAFTGETPFPGAAALLPCIGAGLIIYAGGGGSMTFVRRILSAKPVVFVGKISYSLYLWHWPFLVFAGYWFIAPLSPMQKVATVAVSFVAAVASWQWIEQPFRLRKWTPTRTSLFRLAAIASVLAVTFGYSAHLTDGWKASASEVVRTLDAARGDSNRDRSKCHANDDKPISFAEKCAYGREGTAPTVAIWGDSFAVELAVALGREAEARGESLLYISYSECPPVVGVFAPKRPRCEAHNADILRKLSESDTITKVILIARYDHYYRSFGEAFLGGYERVVVALSRAGKKAIITYPIPTPVANVPLMLARYAQMDGDPRDLYIKRADYLRENAPVIAFLDGLARQNGTLSAHPEAVLCDATRCEVYVDKKVLYYDDTHLSVTGATYVMPAFQGAFGG